MSLASQNLREVTAQRCYDIWAVAMGVTVPWEHVEERVRRAFREVLEYAGEVTACPECGSDLTCSICDPEQVDFCLDCDGVMVCPKCDGWVKPAEPKK